MIRFHCASCKNPIEIDDQWAEKLVGCPFCHNTMTAPAESTIGDVSQVPLAAPYGAPPSFPPAGAGGGPHAAAAGPAMMMPASTNRMAIVAAVFTGLAFAGLVAGFLILGAHRLEMEELNKIFSESIKESGFMGASKKMTDSLGGQVPGWLFAYSGTSLGSLMCALIGTILGAIAVTRPRRRGLALASVVCSGTVLMIACMGFMLG